MRNTSTNLSFFKKRRLFTALAVIPLGIMSFFAQCPSASFTTTAPSCVGTSVDFTNISGNTGPGWTYFWDFDYPGGGSSTPAVSTAQNPTNINYSVGGSGVYTVLLTITNGTCSSMSLMDIDIRTARANFAASKSNICAGDSILFFNTGTLGSSPNANVTHSWSFGAGAYPSTSNAVIPPAVKYTTSGSKTITHYVTVNYGPCGSGTRTDLVTQVVNVNPSPTPNFTSNSPVCLNASVNFTYTGGGGTTYNWDFGQNSLPQNSTSNNPSGISYSSAGTKVITLTTVNSFGCSTTFSNAITINSTPVANFTSTAPKCTGLSVDFTNTGTTAGTSWLWNLAAGSTPSTSTVQNPNGIVYSTAGTKIVSLTTTNLTTGCVSTSTQAININLTPSVSFASNATQCAKAPVNFTNTGTSGSNWSYLWDLGNSALPQVSSSENPTGVLFGSGGNKTITFTIYDGNCTQTATQTININPLPPVNAGKDTIICANTSIQIGSPSLAGYTYSWVPSSTLTLNSSIISNPTASPIAPVTNYSVIMTNTTTGCSAKATVVITMLPPIIANAGVDGVICRNDSIQIGEGLVNGQTYSWLPIAGLSNPTSPNPVTSPSVTTTYTLTAARANCKLIKDEVTIIVHQLPKINIGKDDTITVGSNIQLIATGGIQYNWSPGYGLNNIGVFNPIASPTVTSMYIVKGIDVYGCINYDTINVIVIAPNFWIPNAFTPNDDSFNDVLFVRGDGVNNFEFGVFTKWGEEVFFTKDMKTGWDGKKQISGESLPAGAYVYVVKGTKTNGDPVNVKGLVNLIR